MQKLSEIISKKVYSFASGSQIGYVLNVVLDGEYAKVDKLIVVDEETEEEAEIDFKDAMLRVEGVFVTSEEKLNYVQSSVQRRLLGKQVFINKGENLGKIKEILLKNGKIQAFLTNFVIFSSKNISFDGRDFLVVGGKKKDNNFILQKNETPLQTPSFERLVKITEVATPKETKPAAPYRISSDPSGLIGKMATKDIVGLNNELIIKKFEIITAKKISEARKHNKLNILFYNCK